MWYCNKCSEWYDDSVTILKHFQVLHPSVKSPVKGEDSAHSTATLKKICTSKVKKVPSMKTKLASHVLKRKNDLKNKNSVPLSKKSTEDSSVSSPKKRCLTGGGPKLESGNKKSLSNSHAGPKKIQMMHITNMKGPSFMNKLNANRIDADDVFDHIKTYICKYCCCRFPNAGLLQTHLITHKENPTHSCHVCGLTASTFSALMAHYVKHSHYQSFSVTDMSKKNTLAPKLASVKKEPDKTKSGIFCTACRREFSTKNVFNSHYCPALNKKTEFVCTYCRKVTPTVEEYRDHIQSHSPALFVCGHCYIKFETKSQLQAHFKTCDKKPKNNMGKTGLDTKLKFRKLKVNPPAVQGAKTNSDVDSSSVTKKDNISSKCNSKVNKLTSPPLVDQEVSKIKTEEDMKSQLPKRSCRPTKFITSIPLHSDVDRGEPTRRSARLVNRKQIKFSNLSSDDDVDNHSIIEVEQQVSPRKPSPNKTQALPPVLEKSEGRSASPTKAKSVSPIKAKSLSPTKTKVQKSPKSGKQLLQKPFTKLKQENRENKPSTTLYCNLCSLIFRSIGSLKRHKKMHTGKPQFICQFCGKFFFRRDIHRRHENNVHPAGSEQSLICYYCKEVFDTSAELKEHGYAVHAAKTTAPERIRRCTPVKCAAKVSYSGAHPAANARVENKQKEIPQHNIAQESENSSSCVYKCGTCQVTFEKPSDLVRHFEDVHSVSDNLNIVKLQSLQASESQSRKGFLPTVATTTGSEKSQNTVHKTVSTDNANNAKHKNDDASCTSEKLENEVFDTNDSLPQSSLSKSKYCTKEETSVSSACQMCFSVLPNGAAMCDRSVMHKAVTWYQCSMCSASGPLVKMKEHMLNHMIQIGIFVVNSEDENFNGLSSYLPSSNHVPCITANYSPSVVSTAHYPFQKQNIDDDDASQNNSGILSELLRSNKMQDLQNASTAYSVCSLISEVKCAKCEEIIVDFDILKHHSCLEDSEGVFSCCLENCQHNSVSKHELIEHMRLTHCETLYSDLRTEAETTDVDLSVEGNESCDTVQLRFSETEKIIMEPYFEIISSV